MLPSSSDNFPHLIQKRRSQLGFVAYLLTYLHINVPHILKFFNTNIHIQHVLYYKERLRSQSVDV
jgi:hypothetical protein